ncbi:hypothetical protein [Bradyrhizobium sp. SZCCHNR1045]|uniref:hypothetical protein n=1 Tax=Bradyrhizobium sp. SZCCHNR1045 TaxID=3057353 RepID=UPI002916DE9F|nr:hypothetical protein [Bradyrhizobium sp. SZCCHNR1045]
MNVTRGLFRLWLVLSLCWITFVGVMTYETLPPMRGVPPGFNISAQPNVFDQFDDDATKHARAVWDNSQLARQEQIETSAAIALIIPGIVLLTGSLLLWAVRGFRPSP